MKIANLLDDISRLYTKSEDRGQSLKLLLEEIQYAHASLSADRLGYLHIDIENFRENPKLREPVLSFLDKIKALVNYYLSDVNQKIGTSTPMSTTDEEYQLYEDLYFAFGRMLSQYSKSDSPDSESETNLDVSIFLVLSGLSRKAVYPKRILELKHRKPDTID